MSDTSKSKETASGMMVCDGMPESKPAKDNDMSSNESSINDRWKGYTIQRISDVSRESFGGHWLISCSMYDADGKFSRRLCRKQEYYQECIKNPKCLKLMKEYAAKNEEGQLFYEEIEKDVINATTDDDISSSPSSSSSSSSSLSVSSSAKKLEMFLTRKVKFKKSSLPDGKKRPIVETNLCTGDKTEYTMPD
eukprot:28932-Ditylum_brightwellii.AAC.1